MRLDRSVSNTLKQAKFCTLFSTVSDLMNWLCSERDAMLVERSNMLSVLKLVVKQLIDSSLSQGCMLDDVQGPLLQFFTIMESMMCHGIKREICLIYFTSTPSNMSVFWGCLKAFFFRRSFSWLLLCLFALTVVIFGHLYCSFYFLTYFLFLIVWLLNCYVIRHYGPL